MNPKHVHSSVAEAIGNTPLVELSRLGRDLDGTILAKLEYLNPGFSKKDRIARQMIEEAEANGSLQPGQTVIELTSGNAGTSLAIVCTCKGYPFIAVMSRGNSSEQARMMRALGAEVVLVDQLSESNSGGAFGGNLAKLEEVTRQLTEKHQAFRADQFELDSNLNAYYQHTGREIITQANGTIDAFCDFAGTGGSFAGITKALKEQNPQTKCYLVEPQNCPVLSGGRFTDPNHKIQGGGYSMPNLKFIDESQVDGYLTVTDEQAIETTRRLAAEEGIFAGFSSGANAYAARQLLAGKLAGATIVILICDSGWKYLDTDLYA